MLKASKKVKKAFTKGDMKTVEEWFVDVLIKILTPTPKKVDKFWSDELKRKYKEIIKKI